MTIVNNYTLYRDSNTESFNFYSELEQLERSFRAIVAKYKKPWQIRTVLNKVAAYHDLPKAEIRKIFDLWLVEQTSETIGGEE